MTVLYFCLIDRFNFWPHDECRNKMRKSYQYKTQLRKKSSNQNIILIL